MPKPTTPPHLPLLTRKDIANRIKDEMRATAGPAVDFGSSSIKEKAQPAPDITTLMVSVTVRRDLEKMINAHLPEAKELVELIQSGGFGHLGLGCIERAAKKLKDYLAENIKEVAIEVGAADELPCFSVGGSRVARYTTHRESFDKDVLKLALLRLGVQPRIINEAMGEATTKKPVQNLRISEPGEESE